MSRSYLALLILIFCLPAFTHAQSESTGSTGGSGSAASTELSSGSGSSFTPAQDYKWPTGASHFASSSFGETRAGHFHAALDIKTWGRKGYKVFATRDGILHRIGISAIGYGNVVYLKHKDGSYSVYAHLLKFVPKIQHLVDSLRMQHNYTFEFDQNMENYDIHFKQGQVIGYTGASGVGPPHLHFELRTPSEKPFNPLLTNIKIQDHRPPRFSGLSIEPLHAGSLVEGKKKILTKRPRRTSDGYSFGTVDVNGAVGLGVDVFDQADKVSNVYAAYQLSLKHGDQELFHAQIDSFSYKETDQMLLDRVYPILKKTHKGYQRLYVVDGNTLPFYSHTRDNGIIDFGPGTYKLTITAADFFGNTSSAHVTLKIHSPEDTEPDSSYIPQVQPDLHERPITDSEIDSWYWNNNWVTPRKAQNLYSIKVLPLDSFDQPAKIYHLTSNTTIPLTHTGDIILKASDKREVILHRLIPAHAASIYSPDQRASVHFQPDAFYDTLSVGLANETDSSQIKLHIFPGHDPLHSSFTLSYLLDRNQFTAKDKPAFYYYSARRNRYYYVTSELDNQTLKGQASSFGTYYILSDTTEPTVTRPRISRRADGKWLASVHVGDDLSGINFHKVKIYCNGVRGIPVYDPEHDRIIYYHPDFTPKSKNTLRIEIPDQVDNWYKGEFTINR